MCIFLVEKFDYEGLRDALEYVAEFEKRANIRVINSGVLKGLHLEDIKRAGQRFILREGCREFFQKIVTNDTLKTEFHVLSYCWCGDFIRSAFSSGIIFKHLYESLPCRDIRMYNMYEETLCRKNLKRKLLWKVHFTSSNYQRFCILHPQPKLSHCTLQNY